VHGRGLRTRDKKEKGRSEEECEDMQESSPREAVAERAVEEAGEVRFEEKSQSDVSDGAELLARI